MDSSQQNARRANDSAVDAGFIDARARREFFAMCGAGFLFSVTHNYSALLAIVFERSGHDLPTTGLLLSLFAPPAIAAAFFSSAIVSRLGPLAAARWAIFLTVAGLCSLALTRENFTLALISRIVQAVGVGLFLPAAMVYVQSRITRARFVYLVTVFSAGIPLAAAIAPPLGEWTLRHFGDAAMFVQAAIPGLIGIALTFGLRAAPSTGRAAGLALTGAFRGSFILPYIAVMTGGALYGFSVSYLAVDLQSRAITLAAFFVPSSVGMVAVRFIAMRWLSAMRPPRLVTASLAVYALSFVLIAIARDPLVMGLAGVAFGVGNAIMFPVVSAWLGEGLQPSERAGPQAIGTAAFYLGIYATPFPQTFMIASWGFFATEMIFAGLAALVAMVLVVGVRK
ncbi:MAG: MFS transporter [Beijerinckiaceae bacterium]|nr:MFS transporter [Beijerinckiaceae bacterium]